MKGGQTFFGEGHIVLSVPSEEPVSINYTFLYKISYILIFSIFNICMFLIFKLSLLDQEDGISLYISCVLYCHIIFSQ